MANRKPITRAQLEEYRARWQAIAEIEREEARQATIESRWQQLNALFDFGYELGWVQPDISDQLAAVRARWARLKANYT